jgi:hypothetical protein
LFVSEIPGSLMTDQAPAMPALAAHGTSRLPAVEVESYNVEIKDDEGFVGDRACKGAFRAFIENWRKPLRDLGHDPFGDEPSNVLTKNASIPCSPTVTRSGQDRAAQSDPSPRSLRWLRTASSS